MTEGGGSGLSIQGGGVWAEWARDGAGDAGGG